MVALGVGAVLAVTQSTAAHAALVRAIFEENYASHSPTDGWLEVCDMVRDGHGVRGEFVQAGRTYSIGDPNGSSGGCGNGNIKPVEKFRVCVTDQCSGWKYIIP
jgi:hypothetical protein